ncbi:UV radiation resistance protein and autophagy-related subunit 14-domain-containing protein [Dichomitus squalens]|uniref:Autophagy-related protein 14 n=1 Tax=Dichomitus squalens TaxID=114155 RepID=A0A4Q9ML00_9APHY|nr:UV radiation resistance protein and autophagy-related subunit 14-domain-containing protein [Dichomitus squalens]
MECQNCELRQRQFYCENCLRQHLLSLRLQTQHAATDRDAHIASAEKALAAVVDPARLRRAELRGREEKVQEIWEGVNRLRSTNEDLRERVQMLRNTLATRRRTLAIATSTILQSYSASAPPTPSTSASPPHAPLSTSPQAGRALPHRAGSSISSHSSTPPASGAPPISRPLSSASRPLTANFFTSSSPQAVRSPLGVPTTPPQSYSRPSTMPGALPPYFPVGQHARTVSAGSAPYGTPISTRGLDPLAKQIEDLQAQLAVLSDTIARARAGLVQELVEVFSVVEVGGRPPIGGKAGTKGEWTIGGLVLPVPGDIRRYPPDHINAVLTHTIHFVTLLAFYLGIKLPFEIIWSRSSTPPSGPIKGSGLLGVGIPWIGAIRGGESGGWARWSSKQPLHVSSAPSPASSSSSSSNAHPSSPSSSPAKAPSSNRPLSHRSQTTPTTPAHPPSPSSSPTFPYPQRTPSLSSSTLADSTYAESSPAQPATSSPGGAFTTALAMLLYDVCYLAHTQGVDVPLAHAGDALGNLWAVCCAPELGRRAHATRPPLLPPPTPPAFALDFAQLLQATAATPARAKARGKGGKGAGAGREVRTERIVEEDEGWDLLDVDAELIDS